MRILRRFFTHLFAQMDLVPRRGIVLRDSSSKQRGFTLVELLIVIAVVGILTVGLLTLLNPFEQIEKAQDAKRKSDLVNVQKALEQYYQDNGSYPQSVNGSIVNDQGQEIIWGSGAFGIYLPRLPQDSTDGKTYTYLSSPSGDSYWLFASLDRPEEDPDACNADGSACAKATQVTCGIAATHICNFGVSSPNVSPN